MDKKFHPTLYWSCDYLSMLELKLIHVNKGAIRRSLIKPSQIYHMCSYLPCCHCTFMCSFGTMFTNNYASHQHLSNLGALWILPNHMLLTILYHYVFQTISPYAALIHVHNVNRYIYIYTDNNHKLYINIQLFRNILTMWFHQSVAISKRLKYRLWFSSFFIDIHKIWIS